MILGIFAKSVVSIVKGRGSQKQIMDFYLMDFIKSNTLRIILRSLLGFNLYLWDQADWRIIVCSMRSLSPGLVAPAIRKTITTLSMCVKSFVIVRNC